jgi:hypothetical protein
MNFFEFLKRQIIIARVAGIPVRAELLEKVSRNEFHFLQNSEIPFEA